ncbi:response regulator [Sphingomonas jatrophae]|uniref:Response regulator receiver domain-containing protein n=1 Tax=Sphingomonas jatrophae TaxID=1166337 RepID=A0A1I6M7E7_9SPHN|nr:response regulator [Sphingomonas jatrophae]SFS11607.1 Response regulator receiver domain-containing protein [Sphingomonas jatrophae]
MPERSLRDCRILVVEDEYMLADELRTELGDAGAIVLGPVGNVEDALELVQSEQAIDGGILDVNLSGEMVFPAADLLTDRGVPFVFTTGYDASAIPSRFADVVRCEKPINIKKVTQAIGRVIHS